MFDREPNIDIVFRNGLKDLEILPPENVWENIPPVPVRQHRFPVFVGIAAGLAVIVSFTVLASWLARTNELSETKTQLAAMVDESGSLPEPQLLRASVMNHDSPLRLLASLSSQPGTRKEETIAADYTAKTLPVFDAANNMALNETAVEASPLIAAGDAFIIFPRGLAFNSQPEKSLTMIQRKTVEGKRFLLGASVSPSFGMTRAGENSYLTDLMKDEEDLPSYSTGLSFAFRISGRLSIQSGIGISTIGQMISGVDVYAGMSKHYSVKGNLLYTVESAAGRIYSGNPDVLLADEKNRVTAYVPEGASDPSKYSLDLVDDNLHQVFRYLEVPVLLRYKIIDRVVDLNISGGMAYGYLVGNDVFAVSEGGSVPVGHTDGVNMHSFSSQIGIGIEYDLSKKISLNVEPVLRYYMTPVSNYSGAYSKPLSVGVSSGLFYRF